MTKERALRGRAGSAGRAVRFAIGIVGGLLVAGAPLLGADPPTVSIALDASGPSTRLVLTHSRPVVFAITEEPGRIEVLYIEPVTVDPPGRALDDALLRGWSVADPRRLVFETGPGYEKFDSFELRNPSRLVLDLLGDRAKAGPSITAPIERPAKQARAVIVIDPGHGGVEQGAIGPAGLLEKEVALDIARRVRRQLAETPDVEVVLTRDDDRHVPLDERTAIANNNRADLFLSIHLNASRRPDAQGAETYFLSADSTDDEARTLAGLENGVPTQLAASLPPDLRDRGLDLLLWDLAQNQFLAESSALAETVQRELNALTGTRDRGIRQAPFRVLMGATMPAILVEVGFITNPDEERLLQQPVYRDRIAEAIARAVDDYLRGLEVLAEPGRRATGKAGAP